MSSVLRGLIQLIGRTIDRFAWNRTVGTFQTGGFPAQLAFHAYDPHLAVTNEHDSIRSVPVYTDIRTFGSHRTAVLQCLRLAQQKANIAVLQR